LAAVFNHIALRAGVFTCYIFIQNTTSTVSPRYLLRSEFSWLHIKCVFSGNDGKLLL